MSKSKEEHVNCSTNCAMNNIAESEEKKRKIVGRPTGSKGMTENQLKIRREKLLIKLMTHSIEELDGNRWEKKKEKKEDEHKRY